MNYGSIYGRLGRVGVATPFGGEIVIHDFHRHLHPDIMIAELQIPFDKLTPEGLQKMSGQVALQVAQFKQYCPVDLVLFSCTSGSQVGGPGYDARLCAEIKAASGAQDAVTTTTAVLRALRALESRTLSVVTPYPDDVNAIEKAYLEREGFVVTSIDGMKTADPTNPNLIGKLDPKDIYDFAVAHFDPAADTLFLSCTGLTAFDIIDPLERRLGVPVVTSNQCAAWAVGKFFGYHGATAYRLGTLFSK